MKMVHVEGKNAGQIILYALSTCGWCKKTRELLRELGVSYDYIYTDRLVGKEKEDTEREIQKWNPSFSFPTLVINNQYCIVGFDKDKIKKALEE
jgi:glutaredoxin